MNTKLTINGRAFLINGQPTYSELPACNKTYYGMLMNARMIQGVFADREAPERFNRFGRSFDPDRNTDDLVAALPAWYAHGLRAITVGLQGGGPCFTTDNLTIDTNPFRSDGSAVDPHCLARMERIIRGADAIGMVVIVSFFYGAQTRFLADDDAVLRAVKVMSNWLRDRQYQNVIIEIANEHDIENYRLHPILFTADGVVRLIQVAQRESGGMPVGCSGTGGYFNEKIAQASDVILIHGNDQSRQRLWQLIQKAKAITPVRPVVVNEDSQALGNMTVCMREGVSWGYYNNMTKQEPPTDWSITPGEDQFFAERMALMLGIHREAPDREHRFYLQGLEENMTCDGKRWIRLATLYPEEVDYVTFMRNGQVVGCSYDDPFTLGNAGSNWYQPPFCEMIQSDEKWSAEVHLRDSSVLEIKAE